MRNFLSWVAFFLACQCAYSYDHQKWDEEIAYIKEEIAHIKNAAGETFQTDQHEIFLELDLWHPRYNADIDIICMIFRDRYLHDEAIRPLIQATFIPSVIGFFAKLFSANTPIPTEETIRLLYFGNEFLKQVHKIPYVIRDGSFIKSFTSKEDLASYWAMAIHLATITFDYQSKDLVGLGSVMIPFALLQSMRATDYLEVALRSLQRGYEMRHEEQKVALILQAIGIYKGRKAKA